MKILFVIAHIGKGGGQVTQSIRLIKEISKHHETRLLTLKYKSDIVDEPCKTIYAGDLRFPHGIYYLWKKLITLKEKFDIIQCLDGYYALPAVFLSGRRPYFLRLGLSTKSDFESRGWKLLSPIADIQLLPLFFSSGFVVNSDSLKKELKIFKPNVIMNGYDLDSFLLEKSKYDLRKELRLPKKDFIMLFTGKIIKRKNLEIVFNILDKVKNTTFIIVGNSNEDYYGNSYLNTLKNKYSKILSKVKFIEEVHMDNVKKYLNSADVFVFPSKNEGSPNSVLEAMASKLPVICYDIPNHREIIKHNNTGMLFSSEKELLNAINKLKKNPRLRKTISDNAHEYVKKNHDIKTTSEKYIEMYKKCIS